jgi:cytolysin-activating lysine-acyltransferase
MEKGSPEVAETRQRIYALGAAVRVLGGSRRHLGYTVADLSVYVATPILLGQFMLFHKGAMPVAFVAWAKLSESVAAGYASGTRELTADDWQSGDQLWFIELVAPFGHGAQVLRELRRGPFRTVHARSVRLYDGGRRRVADWYGEAWAA